MSNADFMHLDCGIFYMHTYTVYRRVRKAPKVDSPQIDAILLQQIIEMSD